MINNSRNQMKGFQLFITLVLFISILFIVELLIKYMCEELKCCNYSMLFSRENILTLIELSQTTVQEG